MIQLFLLFKITHPDRFHFERKIKTKLNRVITIFFFNIPFFTIYFNLSFFVNHSVNCVTFSAILVTLHEEKTFSQINNKHYYGIFRKKQNSTFVIHKTYWTCLGPPLLPLVNAQRVHFFPNFEGNFFVFKEFFSKNSGLIYD